MKMHMNEALEIVNEWNSKSDDEQISLCTNCVGKAIKQGMKLGRLQGMEDAVNSTFATVAGMMQHPETVPRKYCQRIERGYSGDSLVSIVCRAARATLQREAKRDRQEGRILLPDTDTDENGMEYSLFDYIKAPDDTERAATIRIVLRDLYSRLDERDKAIFCGMVEGKSGRKIAPTVGVSHVIVSRRIRRIRAQLATML